MHEVEALFEANRDAACRVEQVLITVRGQPSAPQPLPETLLIGLAPRPQSSTEPTMPTHLLPQVPCDWVPCPSPVTPFRLQGIERTKGYVVARELEDVRAARTLEEVLEALQGVHSALDSLGIFEAVEINIDRGDAVLLCVSLTCLLTTSYASLAYVVS